MTRQPVSAGRGRYVRNDPNAPIPAPRKAFSPQRVGRKGGMADTSWAPGGESPKMVGFGERVPRPWPRSVQLERSDAGGIAPPRRREGLSTDHGTEMEVERGAATQADVRRVLRTLWRRKYWVVFSVGVAVFLALVSASRQTKLYEASANVRFDDPADSSLFGLGAVRVQTPEQQAATEQQTASAPEVKRKVAEQLGAAQYRHIRGL